MKGIELRLVVLAIVLVSCNSLSITKEYTSSLSSSEGFENIKYFVQENAKEVAINFKINNPDECGGLDLWISTKEAPCNQDCSIGIKKSIKLGDNFEFNTLTHENENMQWKVDQDWYLGVARNDKSGNSVCSFSITPRVSDVCPEGQTAKFLRIGLGERVVCVTKLDKTEEKSDDVSSRAVNCAAAGDGFYCRANGGYTWCAGGQAYLMNCPTGTACNCGLDVKCDVPCPFACEIGVPNAASTYCNSKMGSFDIERPTGYFCDGLGSYYQCERDSYCPLQASPRSKRLSCPSGTTCSCNNPEQECLSVGERTHPCSSPAVSDCSIKLDCDNLENGFEFCGESRSCNLDEVDELTACFWHADTDTAVCAEDFSCDTGIQCNTDADCPSRYICAIKSCCGFGVCAAKCGF